MSRLFRLTALLFLLCLGLILATRLIGSTQAASTLARITSRPDGSACDHPCLFGVQPGYTTVDEALALLKAHPLTQDGTWKTNKLLRLAGPQGYVAFSQTSDGLIDNIVLSDEVIDTGIAIPESLADSFALGDVLLAFGVSNVGLPGSDYFVVNAPVTGMTASFARPYNWKAPVQPTTAMSQIMLSIYRSCPESKYSVNTVHPWLGFTTINHYALDHQLFNIITRDSGVPMPPLVTCSDKAPDR